MPEPDSIQPTLNTNGARDPAADRNDSPAQGDSDRLGSTGAEARADAARPAAEPATTPEQPRESGAAKQVGRYSVLGEIGHGGMGVVLRSRDPELGRDLALKLMLGDHAAHPEVVQRFREEAQVGGQLQHPGVVPVYELGCAEDGRPYFTMKLVKGETLAKLLKERSNPAQERPRFLKIFEQVCQAVGYAHAKGVLHRDLKPANIMVGAFGEVQVMDWGLAKVLNAFPATDQEQPTQRETVMTTVSLVKVAREDLSGSQTQEGEVLGTPAYMPPEQALGEINRLDQRADVFSLGAILCEILTGQPPYTGADRIAVQRQAKRVELGDALRRLETCEADEELFGLAKRCLSAEPEGRPRHAGEVARAIETYLANVEERARQAELERASAEARAEEAKVTARIEQARAREAESREAAEKKQAEEAQARATAEQARAIEAERRAAAERRARRLTLGMAAVVLLLLAGGGTVAWIAMYRTEEAGRKARDRMEQAQQLLDRGWEHNDLRTLADARTNADQATEIARGASEAVRTEAARLQDTVQARIAAAEKNAALLAALLDVTSPRETRRYERTESGQVAAIAEPSVDEQYTAAFRHWGLDVDQASSEEVLRQLRLQPHPVREGVIAGLEAWMLHRRQSKAKVEQWQRLLRLANQLDANQSRREVRGMLSSGQLQRELLVSELSKVLLPWSALRSPKAGEGQQRLERLVKAVDPAQEPVLSVLALARALGEAGDIAQAERLLRLVLAARPDQVVLLGALGKLLEGQKRWQEAIGCHRATRAQRPHLGVALAWALLRVGQAVEAEAILRDLTDKAPDNPELCSHHGTLLCDYLHRPAEAEALFRRAIALKPDYAIGHQNLGVALSKQKKLEEAVAAYRKAIALKPDGALAHFNLGVVLRDQKKLEEAVVTYRKAIDLQPDFAKAYNNLGNALYDQKKLDEAVAAHRKAIDLKPDYAVAYNNLGVDLSDQKKLDEAVVAYRQAIALKPDYAEAYDNLGNVLAKQKKLDEAIAAYRQAIDFQPDYALAYNSLGLALRAQKKLEEAIAAYRKAIDLQPDFAQAYNNLGVALYHHKKLDEAEAAYRKAIDLQPDYAGTYVNLGLALRAQKKLGEAVAAFRKAIALQPDDTPAHHNLGHALADQSKLAEAEAAFRKAIALQADYAPAYNSLGVALGIQKKPGEAVAAFRKAIALQPDYAEAYDNLGNVLAEQKKLEEAIAAYRKAIDLQPDFAQAYNNLGVALYHHKKLDEAEAAYRKAIDHRPDYAGTYVNLGLALRAQKKFDDAVAAFRKAIALQPDDALVYNDLGNALREQKKLVDAEAAYRKAIQLQPDFALAHYGLGVILCDYLHRPAEAEAAFRKTIELKPDDVYAHYSLGLALWKQGMHKEAEAAFRKSIQLKPDYAKAYDNLGDVLRAQKKLNEAVAALRKANQLFPNHLLIRNNLRRTERWIELDRQLPAALAGKGRPGSPQEQVELAQFCVSYKERYRAAVHFFADAFAAEPKLADDLQAQHRYNAACAAAEAAAGKGIDAGKLDDKERARLHQQALDWLRTDLNAYTRLVEKGNLNARWFIQQRLAHWQQDTDLTAVRDANALAALTEKERDAWQKLWADVAALRKQVENKQ
jgi:superkiller protein 3